MGRSKASSKRKGGGGSGYLTINRTMQKSNTFENKSQQDIHNAIAHHWTNLPNGMMNFLMDENKSGDNIMTFDKLLTFWKAQPLTLYGGSITSTMCGSSFYLALNYLRLGNVHAAKNLLLNGAFLQEAYHEPISTLVQMKMPCNPGGGARRFNAALHASSSPILMEQYLKGAMPTEYQHMMNFASQNANAPCSEYVQLISDDWKGSSSGSARNNRSQATTDTLEETICVILQDEGTNEQYKVDIGQSSTLKSLFNDYTEARGTSLRLLRFSHNGSTLFLSSVKNKTPQQLGLKDCDTILVTDLSSIQESNTDLLATTKEEEVHSKQQKNSSSSSRRKQRGKNGKKKKQKGSTHQAPVIEKTEEELKIEHSKVLTKIHEEANIQFKQIRQRLNNLVIERSLPKVKSQPRPKLVVHPTVMIDNPPTTGLGGKAGKSHYFVQIGEVRNLYKTSKKPISRAPQAISIDLHGLTKTEALQLLDKKLPQWHDLAMSGSYPFVIPVELICGCGNQILSEAVEGWIRGNEKVSNAPKKLWVPLRNSPYPYAA